MPKQESARFICRECRKRRDRETESSPREPRLCIHCFKKLEKAGVVSPAQVAGIMQGIDAVESAPIGSPERDDAKKKLAVLIFGEDKKPKPLLFEDAEILAMVEPDPYPLEIRLKNRILLKQEKDQTEEMLESANADLLDFFRRNHISGVVYDGYTVAKMKGSRPTIKADLLALAGVPVEVIEKCTVKTEFETVTVREGKREGVS